MARVMMPYRVPRQWLVRSASSPIRWFQPWFTVVVTTCLVLLFSAWAIAQSPSVEKSGVPVTLDGQTILVIQDPLLSRSKEQRAERLTRQLTYLAENNSIGLETLQTSEAENATIIHAEDILLLTVSDQDAKLAGKDRQTLANDYLETIRRVVGEYRERRGLYAMTWALVKVVIGTFALVAGWVILNNLATRLYRWLDQQRNQRIPSLRIQNLELISSDQLSDLLLGLAGFIRLLLRLTIIYIYFSFVFALFPQTRVFSYTMSSYLKNALYASWAAFLNYFPNLIAIGLIVAIAYFVLKFLKLIFSGITRQVFSVPGFYPEWAEPTYRLLTYLVFALSAAIIFPYLPGSSSPSFQAVSLFLGALVSIGATSAVSNIVAGFILVYTRAFRVGDRVKVADEVGIVEEKMLLVTRIRTFENVLVTIPNASLLNSNIINYSALLRDSQAPLMLPTTISLGYEVPWRKVHETLIAAALATPDVLPEPTPFVLQTALNDFYISYELKAFIWKPEDIPIIISALYQNIQDKCNQAGIEICSPHYSAIRDGNHNTIPAQYLPKDYKAPGFNIHPFSDQ